MQPAVYVQYSSDQVFTSFADGNSMSTVITPQKLWGLGLNLGEMVVGLRVRGVSGTGAGVKATWQWSLDGVNWIDATSSLIAEKTTDGDYVGNITTSTELMPFGRVLVTVRNISGSTQKSALLSAWGYYKFRA